MRMTPGLRRYCEAWSRRIAAISDDRARMAFFKAALPELLRDHNALRPVVENMARGRRWPSPSSNGLFNNEVLLYLDASRRFSVRLYFHPARSHSPIHDHSGWGVSGVPFGRLSVVRYELDGKIKGGSAILREKNRRIFQPGEVETTEPWEAGIHKTGTPDDAMNMMVSVYGRPGRRLFINVFDIERGKVEQRYPNKIQRRRHARDALQALED